MVTLMTPFLLAADDAAGAPAAAVAPVINSGDTAWVLTSTALVLMMTIPGLFLFYGGLVRSKNVLSTVMHSFFCAALVGVLWVLCGYSISFGDASNLWWGGLGNMGLDGVMGTAHPLAPTIPAILFVAYQATFAVITPALISGSFAERMRFGGFALFIALWSLLIYAPLCHWVWGGGWIGAKVGALDFAGGTVVHISSGVSALVAAMFIGKRSGYPNDPMPPHNLPFTVMGAGLLWVGWFGFNAGSALGSNELASVALVNTNTAAAAAALSWLLVERLKTGKATLLGIASGAVAGLVVITPAAGFVSPISALVMGLIGGGVCYAAVSLKPRFGYDDSLDVVGVHLVGGITGALLTGVFADKAINSAIPALALGAQGGVMSTGEWGLVGKQAVAVLATMVFCGVGTLVLLALVNVVTPIRAAKEEESVGMDLSQHSERAYAFGGGESFAAQLVSEPRAAVAPPLSGERFTVVLEGVDPAAMMDRWRNLCQDARPTSAEFRALYAQLTTVRGTRFRFRGNDKESARENLRRIFADLGPSVTARVEG
jgi:Amt family ammonium transporter